ncbi:MAG: hypothetical protein ACRDTE_26670 [Pseudonocardiaceae bacterium]
MKLLNQSTIARLALAAITGALVGLFAYFLGGLDGYLLFLIVGVVAGVAIGGLIQLYMRTVRLTEITVTVPQLSQLTFVVNNDDKQTAWELFIEVATRVSTQPLAQDDGFLRRNGTSVSPVLKNRILQTKLHGLRALNSARTWK